VGVGLCALEDFGIGFVYSCLSIMDGVEWGGGGGRGD